MIKKHSHTYKLSNSGFHIQESRGNRKCTDCGGKIPIKAFCLKAVLIDLCCELCLKGKHIVLTKPIQLCATCVKDGKAKKIFDTYRGYTSPTKRTLEETVDKFNECVKHPETYTGRDIWKT